MTATTEKLQPIPVSHVSEEHGYLAQQRCTCGGALEPTAWELHLVPDGMHEAAQVRCCRCGKEERFVFDITRIFQSYAKGQDAIRHAWPIPCEGPYGIRRLDLKRQLDHGHEGADHGRTMNNEAIRDATAAVDSVFPVIDGRYQVFGARKGSMGFTYLCVDKKWAPDSALPYFVVCKCLGRSQDFSVKFDEVTVQAIRREVEIWLEIGPHPNAVPLYAVLGSSPTNLVLVIDAVLPGPHGRITLQDWLKDKEVSLPLALRFARDFCRAMLHCRQKAPGFVHGDLKPSNLLIDVADGFRLKVADFGIAKTSLLGESDLLRDLGTAYYRAPECWDGRPRLPQSDIYALGLILCEMFAGRHPFDGLTGVNEIKLRQAQPIHTPSFTAPGMENLQDLVRRSLAANPSDRPALEEIAHAVGLTPDDEPQTPAREQGRALDWNNKGTALTALGKHREATAYYVNALSLDLENPAGWANLALSFSKIGLLQDAERAYQKCLSFPNPPASVHANYAAHLIRYCRLDKQVALRLAIQHCDKAIDADPNCPRAWCNKASALNSLSQFQEAAEAAQAARRLSPAEPYALVELAFAYWKLGKSHSARKFVEKAISADPYFAPARELKRKLRKRP